MRSLLRLSTFRLALWAVPLYVAAGWLLLGFVYVNTWSIMHARVDRGIEAERRRLDADLAHADRFGVIQSIAARVVDERGSARFYRLVDGQGGVLAANFAPADDEPLQPVGSFVDATVRRYDEQNPVPARLHRVDLHDGLSLTIGRDLSEAEDFRRVTEESLGIAVVVTVLLAMAAGLVTSRAVLARLGAVNRTVLRIFHGRLDQRVPRSGGDDEFDRLAANVNAMLDRIEALMRATREVTDNIAHDLRGPLNRLRGRLELALLPTAPRAEVDEAVRAGLDDIDRLLDTFEALLTVARLDNGLKPDFEPLDLALLAEDLLDYFQPLAEENGQTLTLVEAVPVAVPGDPHLLFQALANLVDNAIRYTPAGGAITLAVGRDGERARVTVADSGPGIPAERRAEALDRFARLDSSRSTPGSGLGLSVVQAVARHHRAELVLADNHPGLAVSLILPAYADGPGPT